MQRQKTIGENHIKCGVLIDNDEYDKKRRRINEEELKYIGKSDRKR